MKQEIHAPQLEAQREKLVEFRAKHPCKELAVAGVRWEYIACGQRSETMLLLNGGLRVAETAFAYIELFEPHYRVIVPTYPPLWSIDEITNGILAILDAEQAQDILILGQSYGGMVAQVMVQRFPSRAKKLVLSSTGPLSPPGIQRIILRFILALIPLLPKNTIKTVYKKSVLKILSIPDHQQAFWKDYLDHIFDVHLSKADVLSHFRTGADTLDKYAFGMKNPWPGDVLVIGGENDPVSSDADRRGIIAYYPNISLNIIPGAGHAIAMEKPDEYLASIKAFIDGG
ncbi:MAG: alpha/beta hydrolase [Chloroflexi bacterium]|nr:alpha/beta hydrolase [Chloroflexota bacterium]